MSLKRHSAILLEGLVVVAPVIITVYVVVKALWWLDSTVRLGLSYVWPAAPGVTPEPWAGIGIVVGIVAIYAVGLVARSWLFGGLIRLGEKIVERIPLVKSLYSALRDMLQFLGGTKAETRGKPAVVRSPDGKVALLGLITQEHTDQIVGGHEGRVAVYLPMSYQLGGYTVYVPRDAVEEAEGLTVEDLLKLSLTAGVGAGKAEEEAGQ